MRAGALSAAFSPSKEGHCQDPGGQTAKLRLQDAGQLVSETGRRWLGLGELVQGSIAQTSEVGWQARATATGTRGLLS